MTAAEIARLAGVGRTAMSNWRNRRAGEFAEADQKIDMWEREAHRRPGSAGRFAEDVIEVAGGRGIRPNR